MSQEPFITIGKIGSTFGVKGWIKIQSFADQILSILNYQPWYISRDEKNWQPIEFTDGKAHGKGVIVKFKGLETPEDVRLLTGAWVGVPRSALPNLTQDEYYWSDLVGLTVINTKGKHLGTVQYLLETGANDVLVAKEGKQEIAIPFILPTIILKVDLQKQEILVDWEPI